MLWVRSVRTTMVRFDPAARLGAPGRLAAVFLGGVGAVVALFWIGDAVWNGRLPPGSFLAALVVVFLAAAYVVPIPDPDGPPDLDPVWESQLDREDADVDPTTDPDEWDDVDLTADPDEWDDDR